MNRLFLAIAVLCLAGCHTMEKKIDAMEERDRLAATAFVNGYYDWVGEEMDKLIAVDDVQVSRPLYQLEKVSALLMQDRDAEAHELMSSVATDIETLFDPKSSKEALSVWHGENKKVFKGDNHERALLYAFLAMSYLERGEYENAVVSVRNGLLCDSSNESNQKYSSDFSLLHYLGYVAARSAGDTSMAEDCKAKLIENLGAAQAGSLVDKAELPNAFLVVWNGSGPSYARGGEYDEIRYLIPGRKSGLDFSCVTEGRPVVTGVNGLCDVNFQARTRGGREVDHVLAQKANLKSGLAASGNILIVAGMACMTAGAGSSNRDSGSALAIVGAACIALGGTSHLVGLCVNPTADARYWKNLPDEMVVIPLHLQKGKNKVKLISRHFGFDYANETYELNVPGKGIAIRHVQTMREPGVASGVDQASIERADALVDCLQKLDQEKKGKRIDWKYLTRDQIVGTWRGSWRRWGSDPWHNESMVITYRADGTFTEERTTSWSTVSYSGTWSYSDGALTSTIVNWVNPNVPWADVKLYPLVDGCVLSRQKTYSMKEYSSSYLPNGTLRSVSNYGPTESVSFETAHIMTKD